MAWWDTDWTHRVPITIQSSKVPGNLTDFPVPILLANAPAAVHAELTTGNDIRICSDETTQVPAEVVSYDSTADTGEVYAKLDPLGGSNVTFYMYFGNSLASLPANDSTYGRENVWKSGYQGVWHAETLDDSTSNGRDLTAQNGASLDSTAGAVGNKRLKFLDGNDRFAFSPNITLNGVFTLSMYINNNGPTDGINLFGGSAGANDLFFQQASASAERLRMGTGYAAQYIDLDNAWRWLVIRRHSNNYIYAWRDNVAEETPTFATANSITVSQMGDSTYNPTWDMDGFFDEVRLTTTQESDDWRTAEFNSLSANDTFLSWGAVEQNGGGGVGPRLIHVT